MSEGNSGYVLVSADVMFAPKSSSIEGLPSMYKEKLVLRYLNDHGVTNIPAIYPVILDQSTDPSCISRFMITRF
jgi:hypothetical protein